MKDFLTNWQLVASVSTAIIASLVSILGTRRHIVIAVREEAASWERLANARTAELTSLTSRISSLEQDIQAVRRENYELREINLTLQRENFDLQGKITKLQSRIILLETMLQTHKLGDITTTDVE